VRALSATGDAIALFGLAEAAGGSEGGEALVEGGGADAAARAQLGKRQRVVDIGERGGDALVDGTGRRRLRCAPFDDFEREGVGALSEFECHGGHGRRGAMLDGQDDIAAFAGIAVAAEVEVGITPGMELGGAAQGLAGADAAGALLGDETVADHPRDFRRDQIIYDPWHYLPVLIRKPGALRNGAPFKDWELPPALTQVRAKLKQHADGDRQFVKVLGAVLDHGLAAVEAACAEALEAGIANGDVILTVLARRRQPAPLPSITTPDALRLKIEPAADCGRYDSIRKIA